MFPRGSLLRQFKLLAFVFVLACAGQAAETIKVPCTADVWISSTGKERDCNMGAAKRIKLKGYQEYGLLNFDVAALKGKKVTKAFLHIAPAEGRKNAPEARGTDLRWFSLSTISSPWKEGQGTNYTLDYDGEGACFNYAEFDAKAWSYAGSKNWDVILGNGQTLRSDVDAGDPKDGWFAIPVDLRLVHALVSGTTHGLLLMDGSVFISTNAFIHSRESEAGKGPYLSVEVDGEDKDAPPAVTDLKLEPAPLDASANTGAAAISFKVPEGAFAYEVKLDGKEVQRWQVPFAAQAGTAQRFTVEWIEPSKDMQVEVVALDAAGNKSSAATAAGKSGPKIEVPKLPRIGFRPVGGDAPVLGGKLKVWAFPEVSKLDPQTGSIVLEKESEFASERNAVWDASTKTIRMVAAKGEIAGVQLALESLDGAPVTAKVAVEGLEGIETRLWKTWCVPVKGKWYPDYAIPPTAGEGISIPFAENKIPNQKATSAALDFIVPANAKPGTREAKLKVSVEGLGELALNLNVTVFDVTIPAETNFVPELNCYSGPLGPAGSPQFFDAFRVAHYHRCTINRVPHSHNGRTHEDWIPKTSPEGKITDWTPFESNLGPLLDGSAFKHNPRAGVPVPVLYLPFNESWPLPIKGNYQPGESVPLVGKNWKPLHDMLAKPPEEAFPQTYKDAFANAVKDTVAHFEAKGWNRTIAQCYNNNKYHYGKVQVTNAKGEKETVPGMTGTAWTLDEPASWLDWQALLFYSRLFHKGLDGVKTTKFAYRGDISRPMWQGSCFDGLMEVMVSNNEQFNMNPMMRDHKRRMPTKLWAYGGCNPQDQNSHQTTAWCLKAYVHDADGILPWQTIGGDKSFDVGDYVGANGGMDNGNMLVVDGSKRFGVNAIGSYRLQAMRSGAQICELLRLLEQKHGWSRAHSAALVSQLIPLRSEFKQAFSDDAAAITFGDLNAESFVRLKEGILQLLAK